MVTNLEIHRREVLLGGKSFGQTAALDGIVNLPPGTSASPSAPDAENRNRNRAVMATELVTDGK